MTKFFHMRDGQELVEDLEGTDLPDAASAHEEAIVAAREMLADRLKSGKIIDGQQFEIFDENGRLVEIVPFKAALRLE